MGAKSLFLLEANKALAGVDLKVQNLPALVCSQSQHEIQDSPLGFYRRDTHHPWHQTPGDRRPFLCSLVLHFDY